MLRSKMKYMGSKRAMLKNGLGEILEGELPTAHRFVDLFTGSGAVAMHVAQRFPIPVVAVDIQKYSTVVAAAVISRRRPITWQKVWDDWCDRAVEFCNSIKLPRAKDLTTSSVFEHRAWCSDQIELPITHAYGGHYFSLHQAVWIDALRATLPSQNLTGLVALAAIIQAASQCAAAPGHTAQPFQPTSTALPFLKEAWSRDVVRRTQDAFSDFANVCAMRRGSVDLADANDYALLLRERDLVFIDPPYSGVHYSRFYHVLETIAQGECGEVSGVGRYPDPNLRPRSRYSLKSESEKALEELLHRISSRRSRAILTFPDHACSNGLSGEQVRQVAHRHFDVEEHMVASRFSTLGGNNGNGDSVRGRKSRRNAQELVFVLNP